MRGKGQRTATRRANTALVLGQLVEATECGVFMEMRDLDRGIGSVAMPLAKATGIGISVIMVLVCRGRSVHLFMTRTTGSHGCRGESLQRERRSEKESNEDSRNATHQ